MLREVQCILEEGGHSGDSRWGVQRKVWERSQKGRGKVEETMVNWSGHDKYLSTEISIHYLCVNLQIS